MQYVTCPLCGANLDPGERCDCKEKEEPPHANELGSSSTLQMPAYIIAHLESEHKRLLRDIRVQSGANAKEIVSIVRAKYRGFDKPLLSKAENAEKYGVQLTPEALRLVVEEYAPELLSADVPANIAAVTEDKPRAAPKRRDTHRLKRSIRCRLEEDDYARLMAYIREKGFDTVQSWLTHTVRKLIKTTTERHT